MVMVISFSDFRSLVLDNNKRIYYYQNQELLELYFISDGVIVQSFVDLNTIENKEIFFSDQMFAGATQLLFKLPLGNDSSLTIRDVVVKPKIVQINMPEETDGGEDIQKEGVGDE